MSRIMEAQGILTSLTTKQREVLDLVLQHKSSKEIARTLQISPYTVDQRVASSRQKLGVASRGELARAYGLLLEICEETACGFPHMALPVQSAQTVEQDLTRDPVYTLSDVAVLDIPAPWNLEPRSRTGLEALDNRFGIFGRILAIFGLAAFIPLMFLALLAIAQTLTKLL